MPRVNHDGSNKGGKGRAKSQGAYPDDFMIYCYKVLPCTKRPCNNWHTCPFVHPGEPVKRRDPRRYKYTTSACPKMKQGGPCPYGDSCRRTHNEFEYWLHPKRFKSKLCERGVNCNKPFCFFAHSESELRSPGAHRSPTAAAAAVKSDEATSPQAVGCAGGAASPPRFIDQLYSLPDQIPQHTNTSLSDPFSALTPTKQQTEQPQLLYPNNYHAGLNGLTNSLTAGLTTGAGGGLVREPVASEIIALSRLWASQAINQRTFDLGEASRKLEFDASALLQDKFNTQIVPSNFSSVPQVDDQLVNGMGLFQNPEASTIDAFNVEFALNNWR